MRTPLPARERHWTRALICNRIRQWAEEHGHTPTASQIAKDKTRDKRGTRMYPQHTQVMQHYSSWDEMVREAGLEPPRRRNRHKPKHRPTLHPRTDHRSR